MDGSGGGDVGSMPAMEEVFCVLLGMVFQKAMTTNGGAHKRIGRII